MSYIRVTPRDLFNESKLLKCLGRFSLCILDNEFYPYRVTEELEEEENGFIIEQDIFSGNIYCTNYHVYLNDNELELQTILNSKLSYPLILLKEDDDDILIFNDDGFLSTNFLEFLKS